jgi:hypothetical protein
VYKTGLSQAGSALEPVDKHAVPGGFGNRPRTPVKADRSPITGVSEYERLFEVMGAAVIQQMLNKKLPHSTPTEPARHSDLVQEHLRTLAVDLF